MLRVADESDIDIQFVQVAFPLPRDRCPTLPPSSEAIQAVTYDALYVVNGGSNSISVIDTETDAVAETIRLLNAAWPHHIDLSDDQSRLAVAFPGIDLSDGHGAHGALPEGIVMVLDARTGATIRARTLDAMNHNAIYTPDATEIWTVQMTTPGAVLVLDATTLATKQTIPVGNMPAEITFNDAGTHAFVANGASNSVSVIDVSTRQVVREVPVGAGPVGAWNGGNGVMYVDNEAGKSLTAIDDSTFEVLRTYPLGFTPAVAAVGPDGILWVTDAQNGKVVFYAAGSQEKLGELPVGSGAHAIAFNGTGTKAYVSNQEGGNVSVIDIGTRTVTRNIIVGAKPNGMVWRGR